MSEYPNVDHVTVVTDDFEASRGVYDAVLGALGLVAGVEYEDPEGEPEDPDVVAAIGYGAPGARPIVWLVAGLIATRNGHVALAVADADLVRAAHQAAQSAHGARIVQAPRDWESTQLSYFGTQIADPHDNVLEIVLQKSARRRP